MNEKIFVNEQTVWVLNSWDCIDECKVLEIPQWNTNYYKLKIKNGGWYNQTSSNIFSTLSCNNSSIYFSSVTNIFSPFISLSCKSSSIPSKISSCISL